MPPEPVLPVGEEVPLSAGRCPSLLVTSLPGRDSWAFEEASDTVLSADPRARVEATRYRGVFAVYSSKDPYYISSRFALYIHAFVAWVLPVLGCFRDLGELARSAPRPPEPVSLEVRLREPLKRRVGEGAVVRALAEAGLRPAKGSELVIFVESLEDLLLLSYGRKVSCGPSCAALVRP